MMRQRVLKAFDNALPLRVGAYPLLFVALQVVFFTRFTHKSGVDAPAANLAGFEQMTVSLAVMLSWLLLADTALSASRRARAAVYPALFLSYSLLASHHFKTRNPFDYAILAANRGEAFTAGALEVIARNIGHGEIALALALTTLLVVFEARTGRLSAGAQTRPLGPKLAVSIALYASLVVVGPVSYDEVTLLLRSVRAHYAAEALAAVPVAEGVYPLVRRVHRAPARPAPVGAQRRPDVFLVLLESVNAGFVGARTERGVEITPQLSALLERGLSVERFYGNSIQTAKAHFAVLFSVIPGYTGKDSTLYAHNSFQALPALMRGNGYETVWFQAQQNLEFDNTRGFLGGNGFDDVRSATPESGEGAGTGGSAWGIPDDEFYRRFLAFLDERERRGGRDRPLFVALAPVANHEDWSHVPQELQRLYRPPHNQREQYANSLHLSDRALGTLLEGLTRRGYLADGILVVTADHSYPMGEHGILYNQYGFYDESFRTPFVLLWQGRVAPRRVTDRAYSQLDIAPTIADAAGIGDYTGHFQGVSMLDPEAPALPIPLVQPYSGKYLAVYDRPYKFIQHLRSGRERLFNLETDPGETDDLIANPREAETANRLRAELGPIFLTQRLLNADRVWPRGSGRVEPGATPAAPRP